MRHTLSIALALLSLCCAKILIRDSKTNLSAPIELPMRLLQDVPAVQVTLPGLGPQWFLVDTGAPISVLSSRLEDKVAHTDAKIPITMEGSTGEKVSARALYINELSLGEVRFNRVFAVIVDLTNIEARAGVELGGVLGFSVFEDLLLTLDYPRETLRLERGELSTPDQRQIFSYDLVEAHPALPATLAGSEIALVLDSGSRDYLSIPEAKQDQFTYQHPPVQIGTSLGIAGEAPCYAARLAAPLAFAGRSVPAPQATFAQIDTFLAGGRLLRAFAITFDQQKRRLRLQQAPDATLNEPSIRGIGAELCKQSGRWEVCASLDEQSLKPKDQLISVSGRSTEGFDVADWQALIQRAESLEITILREGEEQTLRVLVRVLVE